MLDLSEIESGQFKLTESRFDLAELIRNCVEIFRPQAQTDALQLTYEGLASPVMIEADGHRVRQILVNLLSNAIKYTEQGGVTVKLETREIDSQSWA